MSTSTYLEQDHERRLIAAAQSGDTAARNQLILACLPYLRQTVAVYAPSARGEEFEELYQQAIVALYDSLEVYDLAHPKRARLYVFAYSRIRHAVSRYFNVKGREEGADYLSDLPDLVAEPPEQAIQSAQTIAMVRHALTELSPQERQVLCARRASDQAPTRAELARQYGCSQQWIDRVERRAARKFAAAVLRTQLAMLASQ